jgi:bifunctional lysine-specific demethylase and histidyl-hydroxylase NO66
MFEVRGVAVEPSLGWLLQPLAVETFLAEIWGAKHYHVKRRQAGYFEGLLCGQHPTEQLLEHFRPEPSAVRLVRAEKKKGPESYGLADGSLDLVRVRNDLADGYTIVLDGVERYVRPIALLRQSIEVELNFPTQVNAYITPPDSQSLAPHYDDHDVLILQVEGSKTWHLYDVDIPPHEMRHQKAVAMADLPLPSDLRMESGDVLYLPRGRVHAAETNSEPSIHLTVGIHAPTVLTLMIRALHTRSFRDDRLHARLPPRHLDDVDARASVDILLRDLITTFEDPGVVAESLETLADFLVKRGRCPPVGQISNAIGINGETLVVRYQPLYSQVTAVAGGVALQFAKSSIKAAADHQAAMLFISGSTEAFRVRELPGLTAAQQKELARTLIISGFLVRLSDD